MTLIDEAPDKAGAPARRPRFIWAFGALALVFFLVGLVGGSFQGKLSEVQKNENSSFLPRSADSTKVADEQQKFASIQSIPGSIVYQRKGGLTAADRRTIAGDVAAFKQVEGVSADEVGLPQYNKAGDTAAISVPLIGKENGKSRQGKDLVTTEKAVIKAAKDGAPAGLVVHSAGPGGILVAFIDAFSGLDGALLLAAGLVVVVILLFVYRSPIMTVSAEAMMGGAAPFQADRMALRRLSYSCSSSR